MRFREFLENTTEEVDDIQRLLRKIPRGHARMVHGYKWKFQPGNTLKGDDEHIGYVDNNKKEIVIAGPWNYGREFTVLHEIGHQVYEKLSTELRQQWQQIVSQTKHKQNQNAQELFCMAYANHFAKNKIVIHNHPEWESFVKNLPEIGKSANSSEHLAT